MEFRFKKFTSCMAGGKIEIDYFGFLIEPIHTKG